MKRTEWFKAYDISPVHEGLYEWRCLSLFDPMRRPEKMFWSRTRGWDTISPCAQCQWRGLAEKPKRGRQAKA